MPPYANQRLRQPKQELMNSIKAITFVASVDAYK
jgi:hypothetical protein